ncbi:MAG TPA: VWA domain-containing protein [Mycobacteriales bacterium]
MTAPEVRVVPAALAAAFADALHRAGIPATPERAGRFARALQLVPPTDLGRLHRTARATLVSDRSHLETFDRVFAVVFAGTADPADSRGAAAAPPVRTPARRSPSVTTVDGHAEGAAAPAGAFGQPGSAEDDGEAAREARIAAASPAERLGTAALSELSEAELAEVRRLVGDLAVATPTRTTRRTRRSSGSGDRLDLRRTVRRAHRTAGDPAVLVRRRRRTRPRRLVLLCDVSASMEPYTPVYLALLHRTVTDVRAEAFVFATRLTRLTRPLRGGSPDRALRRAGRAAPDWAGGTRLGESLRRFVTDHGRHGVARGAVVVILSDGWAGDDPELVAQQMARLRRLAYRIVWVNPRKAAPGYEPLVGGMAAALPYCDAFVSGHSLAALTEVAEAIREGRYGT